MSEADVRPCITGSQIAPELTADIQVCELACRSGNEDHIKGLRARLMVTDQSSAGGQGSFAAQAGTLSALQERVSAVEAAGSAGHERMACLEATVQKLQAASLACACSGDEALRRHLAARRGNSPWPLSLFLYPFARAARWLMDVSA